MEIEPKSILVAGLGGSAIVNWIRWLFTSAEIDVIEMDSAVVEVARDYFNFNEKNVLITDTRSFIDSHYATNNYDLIILDSCAGYPCKACTFETYVKAKQMLNPKGLIIQNLFGLQWNVIRGFQKALDNSICYFSNTDSYPNIVIFSTLQPTDSISKINNNHYKSKFFEHRHKNKIGFDIPTILREELVCNVPIINIDEFRDVEATF